MQIPKWHNQCVFSIQYKYHLILCIIDTFDIFDTFDLFDTDVATIGFGYQQLHG